LQINPAPRAIDDCAISFQNIEPKYSVHRHFTPRILEPGRKRPQVDQCNRSSPEIFVSQLEILDVRDRHYPVIHLDLPRQFDYSGLTGNTKRFSFVGVHDGQGGASIHCEPSRTVIDADWNEKMITGRST
jgi:hypothetical protein